MNYCTLSHAMQLIPTRGANTHKGDYGKVLCVAGSAEYRGAAALCCLGALRNGAGLVTLAAPEIVIQSVASSIIEAVFLPLPSERLFSAAQNSDCVVIGCGMSSCGQTAQLVAQLLPLCKAVVLDAGALSAIAGNLDVLLSAAGEVIITPHPGEMALLCGKAVSEVQKNRVDIAVSFAREHNVTVLLKGHHSIIAGKNGSVWQNSTGNAGLARGGSGDILAGMTAAMLAMGIDAENSAVVSAYLHGLCADVCAARLSMHSMLPHDILTDLCAVLKENGR